MTGEELKAFRLKKGVTQQALGEALGYQGESAQITVLRWERGTRPIPIKHFRKLARLLDIPVDKLVP